MKDFAIAWIILNSVCRVVIMVIVTFKLTVFHEAFNRWERIGLGLLGGAGILTIPAIWELRDNPFEYWAGALFGLGVLLYLWGKMVRNMHHRRNNAKAVKAAERHFSARGF